MERGKKSILIKQVEIRLELKWNERKERPRKGQEEYRKEKITRMEKEKENHKRLK